MNKEPIIEQKEVIEKIASFHNSEGRKDNYNWVRTCVTILTPSLALLIGFQDNTFTDACFLKYLLVTTISIMTTTVLVGLLVLHAEAKEHVISRNEVVKKHNEGYTLEEINQVRVNLPKHYLLALDYFPHLFWPSVLLLGVFGVSKYII